MWSNSRSTGFPPIKSMPIDRGADGRKTMSGKFSRRQFAKLAGLAALGMAAAPANAANPKPKQAAGRHAPAGFPKGLCVGHRHLGLSDRGRRQRRRPRPLDLGHFRAHAGQDRGQHHRRPRQRALSPLQGRRPADQGSRRQALSVFDRVAAGISRRHRRAQSQGPRFLQPPDRRTAGQRHRALCHAVSLGPAAGAAGPCRRLAIQRHLKGVRGLRRLCRRRV